MARHGAAVQVQTAKRATAGQTTRNATRKTSNISSRHSVVGRPAGPLQCICNAGRRSLAGHDAADAAAANIVKSTVQIAAGRCRAPRRQFTRAPTLSVSLHGPDGRTDGIIAGAAPDACTGRCAFTSCFHTLYYC